MSAFLLFGRMTRFCRLFVILPVRFRVGLRGADHSAVQADDAMLTLDSGSVSLTCSVRGESVVSRHTDSFHTRYFGSSFCDGGSTQRVSSGVLFDTYLLIFYGHALLSISWHLLFVFWMA